MLSCVAGRTFYFSLIQAQFAGQTMSSLQAKAANFATNLVEGTKRNIKLDISRYTHSWVAFGP